jgi:Ni,Fe-hydrogenase III large subunit/NADH:ubiquinone oxidoreductase subunit C
MTTLRELAQKFGLAIEGGAPQELRTQCAPEEFLGSVTALAAEAVLADLFAVTGRGQPSLTVVFELAGDAEWLVLRTQLSGDSFPSLTPSTHVASWYEREIHEMHGLNPVGHPALARLRLHDWPVGQPPMRAALERRLDVGPGVPSPVPIVHGQGVFQLPLGPVRSGPQESGEFLFNSGGEDLVAVSQLLGFKLRVVERLAEGRTVDQALMLAERLAGVSAFSNALAFVQAVERAMAVDVGEQSRAARTLMNELERLHNHFGDIARLADATGLMVAGAQYASLKEDVLRHCAALTQHRYLRGILAVGGLQAPLPDAALHALRRQLADWLRRSERLERLLEDTAVFVDRVETTGVLTKEYAAPHNLVGPIGRSTGADRDCRRDHPYAGYDRVTFDVLVKSQGDALARLSVRLFEIRQSIRIIEQVLEAWPGSDVAASVSAPATREALGWSEGAGGETLHWVALTADGRIARWRARPPAFVNWHPYAEACASGNNLTDYPVIEASFGLSHAEFDR